MSDDLRNLLQDLASYLEQQRLAGSSFFIESDGLVVEDPPGGTEAATETASEPAPVAAPAAPPTPVPAPKAAAAPAPAAARSDRDDAFQQECEAFVRDALGLIARTRAHVPTPRATAVEPDMFGDGTPSPASAQPDEPIDKAAALAAIADDVAACEGCLLHGSRKNTVPGAGNPDAGLVLIGEAPGAAEDAQGLPFVGPSGKLLGDILKAIGFSRDEVFIGNILKCRPPANRDPERGEVEACAPYLRRQLGVIQPRLILCLGRVAAQTLLGTTAPLGSLRRTVHFFAGVPVMATLHPAALLRKPALKRDTWDDVRKLRALYDALGDDVSA